MRILYKKSRGCSPGRTSVSCASDLPLLQAKSNPPSSTLTLVYRTNSDVALSYLKHGFVPESDRCSSQDNTCVVVMNAMGDQFAGHLAPDSEGHQSGTGAKETGYATTSAGCSPGKEKLQSGLRSSPASVTRVSSSFLQDLMSPHYEPPVRSSVLHDFTNNFDQGGISSPALAFMNRTFPPAVEEGDLSPDSEPTVTIHSESGTTAPGTTAPGTTAPGTTAPGTTAPGTTAPGTTAPGTTAPGTTSPGTTAPGTRHLSREPPGLAGTGRGRVSWSDTLCRYDQPPEPDPGQLKTFMSRNQYSSPSRVTFCQPDTASHSNWDVPAWETDAINAETSDMDGQSTKALLDRGQSAPEASSSAMTCVPTHAMTLPLYSETKGAPRCYVVVPLFRKKLTNRQLIQLAAMMGLGFLFVMVILIWLLSPMLF